MPGIGSISNGCRKIGKALRGALGTVPDWQVHYYLGYIDKPDDDTGIESALTWDINGPARFVVGRDKSEKVTVLNPFNFGSDASGCVSRFTSAEQVPDPTHPVQIVLASDMQIMSIRWQWVISPNASRGTPREK